MPRQPTFIDKVNAIIDYVENPCEAPWMLYVETALPAAGQAILTLLDFGFDDVVRGALRPRGLRSHKHTRRGRRGRGLGNAIPEIGELIGANLPGAQQAKGRQVSQGVKNLWLVDGVIQRGLFWWLVADVTFEFLYAWASAIQATKVCSAQAKGRSYYKSSDNAVFFSLGNFWTSPPSVFEQYSTNGASAFAGGHTNAGRPFSGITSIKAVQTTPTGGPLQLRALMPDGSIAMSDDAKLDDQGNWNILDKQFSSNGTIQYQYRTNGAAFIGVCDSFTVGN
jgi:hypothetical protein